MTICTNSNTNAKTNHKSSVKSTNSRKNRKDQSVNVDNLLKSKDDQIWKLEMENQRLKSDLQTIRQCESDLRQQLTAFTNDEDKYKSKIAEYQVDIKNLQKKIQGYQTGKQQQLQTIQKLEKSVEDERKKSKLFIGNQIAIEKKARQAEESVARASAIVENYRNICSDVCKDRRQELEILVFKLRKELFAKVEQLNENERVCRLLFELN